MKLKAVAETVSPDEMCFGLSEVNIVPGNGELGWRRVQKVFVNRGDRLAEHWVDMGPVSEWPSAEAFGVPAWVADPRTRKIEPLHTVGELRDVADVLRARHSEHPKPSDLMSQWVEELDERQMKLRGLTTSGPYMTKVR